jgi:hypothetical protein
MARLSVTYRATIDRHVPILVRARMPHPGDRKKIVSGIRSFVLIRELVRVS